MKTYRYGKWEQWDGYEFYQVEKKTLFGWKEISYWKANEEGRVKMMDMVKQLRDLGNLVIAN